MAHLPDNNTFGFLTRKWSVVILAAVSVLLYINTARNGYVLDDYSAIIKNRIVSRGISAIPEIFTTPYLHGYINNPNDLYRPLSLVMFAVEYQLFDKDPAAGHVVNVLLFACCVVILFLFLDKLFERKKTLVAFAAALLFAAHPVHTEVVANIKSRDELLCFFFALSSLLLFIKYSATGRGAFSAWGSVCFFLSLLSKETSLTFVIIIPLLFFFFHNGHKARSIRIAVFTILAAGIYFAIRFSVLNAYHANHPFQFGFLENSLAGAPSLSTRLATAFYILGKYLWLLVAPYPLISDYSYNTIPLVSFSNIGTIISLIIYVALLSTSFFLLVKKQRNAFSFAILFFLITLSIFANVFFLVGATMAERFLFFPSVGFCLSLALILNKFVAVSGNTPRRGLINASYFLVPVLLTYSVLTVARNNDWHDPERLFTADIKHAPNNYRLYYYLGTELINSGSDGSYTPENAKKLNDGIAYLKRSITIYPDFPRIYSEMGNTYFILGLLDSTLKYNSIAIRMDPMDTFSINKLAGVYFKKQLFRESINLCRKAISFDSSYSRGYRNIGICYLKMEKYDSAIYEFKRSLLIDKTPAVYGFLNIAYKQLGQYDSARKYEQLGLHSAGPQ